MILRAFFHHIAKALPFFLLAVGLLVLRLPAAAATFESSAEAAILVDLEARQVLFEKHADEPVPPASMSKLMTVYMLLDQVRSGALRLDDTLPVSKKAWKKGGSKMFVEVGKRVRVEDLLRGIIVLSGNDACIVVAEALAGSEAAFAEQMTRRGKEIGLRHSRFANASGWPAPDHVMSVRDLAILAERLITEFPDFYHFFGEAEFEYSGIRQPNRNRLLNRVRGADGLKTGYTEEAGYGMVASAIRDGRRLISVVAGLDTPGARALESERLLEHGFRQFKTYQLVTAGDEVERASVWLGDRPTVPLLIGEDLRLAMTAEARAAMAVTLAYEMPLPAPVVKGSTVAQLIVTAPGITPREVPVIAGADVGRATLFGRMTNALEYLIFGPS
jgi:D-alanyl-D-alanine carboxypeptidase (penicillin-binding protein 5/6)